MNRKLKRGLITLVAILGLIYAVDIIIKLIKITKNPEDMHIKTQEIHTISKEDSAIFSATTLQQLQVEFGLQNNYRVVSFCLLNKQYQMILAEADLKSSISLHDSVHVTEGSARQTDFEPYRPEELKDRGEFLFRLATLRSIDNMFITYSGDKIENVVSNDSLLQFHVVCKNFSIRYAADSPVDILLTNENHSIFSEKKMHLDVIFYKHQGKVYFLFLTPIDYKLQVAPIIGSELFKN